MNRTFITTLIAGILLSSCSFQVSPSTTQPSSSPQVGGYSTNSASSSSTTSTAMKGPMKQLSDFEQINGTQVTLTTSKGDITFELYRDKSPITTANFLSLTKAGFYNGMVFHRVIPDFMAQVGDPLSKDPSQKDLWGTGGAGYTIPDEFDPSLKFDSEGIVAMANAGPNTGGNQIFITYGPTPWLDGKHTIFGKVTQGMAVLRNIAVGDTITSATYK